MCLMAHQVHDKNCELIYTVKTIRNGVVLAYSKRNNFIKDA